MVCIEYLSVSHLIVSNPEFQIFYAKIEKSIIRNLYSRFRISMQDLVATSGTNINGGCNSASVDVVISKRYF